MQNDIVNALRGGAGGTVGGGMVPNQPSIDPSVAPKYASPNMDPLAAIAGQKLGQFMKPSVAGAGQMYGPEVAKMGGNVEASQMEALLSNLFG